MSDSALVVALDGLATSWLAALLWLSIASTAVFVVVFSLRALMPTRAAFFRHGLLALVLLRLILPPQVESPWSVWSLAEDRSFGQGPAFLEQRFLPKGRALMGEEADQGMADPEGLTGSASLDSEVASQADVALELAGPGPSIPWALVLLALWGSGVMCIGWRYLHRRRELGAFIDGATAIVDGPVFERFERVRRLSGVKRPVRLVVSDSKVVPFTVGSRRPVILIPAALLGVGDGEAFSCDRPVLESVLAHELAHIERLDDLWIRVQNVLQAIYFFHPAVWLTNRAMHQDRELDCDQRAILALSHAPLSLSPKTYGECFLDVLALGLRTPCPSTFNLPSTAASAFVGRRRIKMRLKNILLGRPTAPKRRQLVWLIAIGLAVLPWAVTGDPQPEEEASSGLVSNAQASHLAAPTNVPTEAEKSRELTLFDLMPGARITSPFGPRLHPIEGTEVHHDGVDLSTGAESAIYAPRGGVVKVATDFFAPSPDMGKVVVIDHGGGIETLYAHLSSIAVEEKSGVSDGALLGQAGTTGKTLGRPHLHFEIRKDGELVDPAGLAGWIGDC